MLVVDSGRSSTELVALDLADGSRRWAVPFPPGGTGVQSGRYLVMIRADGSFTVMK